MTAKTPTDRMTPIRWVPIMMPLSRRAGSSAPNMRRAAEISGRWLAVARSRTKVARKAGKIAARANPSGIASQRP